MPNTKPKYPPEPPRISAMGWLCIALLALALWVVNMYAHMEQVK